MTYINEVETSLEIDGIDFLVMVYFDYSPEEYETQTDPGYAASVEITSIKVVGIGLDLMSEDYSHLITKSIRETLEESCMDWVTDEELSHLEDVADYQYEQQKDNELLYR